MKKFIKKPELLNEYGEWSDLFGRERTVWLLGRHLEEQCTDRSISTLQAPPGTGKSFTVKELSKRQSDDNYWIIFNAWEYTDRENLWYAFVVEATRSIKPSEVRKVQLRLNGELSAPRVIFLVLAIAVISATITEWPGWFLPAFPFVVIAACVLYVLSVLLIVVSELFSDRLWWWLVRQKEYYLGGIASMSFNKNPLGRLEDYVKILTNLFNSSNKNIRVALEDLDRSGEPGRIFLESFADFVRNLKLKRRSKINIKVLAAIGRPDFYCADKSEIKKTKDSLKKSIDNPRDMGEFGNPDRFINEIFAPEFLNSTKHTREHVKYLVELIAKNLGNDIRGIKHILRQAHGAYATFGSRHTNARPIICLVVATMNSLVQHSANDNTNSPEAETISAQRYVGARGYLSYGAPGAINEKEIALVLGAIYTNSPVNYDKVHVKLGSSNPLDVYLAHEGNNNFKDYPPSPHYVWQKKDGSLELMLPVIYINSLSTPDNAGPIKAEEELDVYKEFFSDPNS